MIGAGLSGLTCAFDLVRAGRDVVLLEASERAGGCAGTLEVEGYRFELGPTTLPASAASFRRLCGDLGIAQRLIASSERARERYLLHRGRLRRMPSGIGSLLATPLLSPRAKLFALSEPLRRAKPLPPSAPEPTAAELFRERLGPEPARLFGASFVRGVYAGDADELGARSAFPRLWRLVNEHGGILRGMLASPRGREALPGPDVAHTRLFSFPRGLQELVDALEAAVGADALVLGARALRLERDGAGTWRVHVAGREPVVASALVVATPADVAARLLSRHLPPQAVAHLSAVELASVTLVHLGFDELALPSGFGFLVPPGESVQGGLLGAVFASNVFAGRAPEGGAAVTCFYGADVAGAGEHAAAERAVAELGRALGDSRGLRSGAGRRGPSREPLLRVHRMIAWDHAIPQYTVGHDLRMHAVLASAAELGNLHLAGNYTSGVGVDQVIARGRAVARSILA